MSIKYPSFKVCLVLGVLLFFALFLSSFFKVKVSAAPLTETFVRFDRIEVSTATTGTVCATQTSSGTDASVIVTFPTGYTLGSASNFTVTTTNNAWPAGASVWPGIGTATLVSGLNVTFPSTTLTAGTLYCFNWNNSAAVTNAAAASNSNNGSIATYTSAPAIIDSGTYTAPTVLSDQVSISATVPPAFSFALGSNSDALGTLSTTSITSSPTPNTVTINTNAKSGWVVWGKDANAGLLSSSTSSLIASTTPGTNSTLTAGANGFNTGITSSQTSGTGTIAVATPFVGGSSGKGGGFNTSLAQVASSNGTGGGSVLTLTDNVTIAVTTLPATDYADTVTIVGAGMF